MKHILILLAAISGSLSAAEKWQTHTNPRFGIQIEMPANLKPLAAAPNGSLQSFTDGRFTLTIHGHFLTSLDNPERR